MKNEQDTKIWGQMLSSRNNNRANNRGGCFLNAKVQEKDNAPYGI